jgi:oligosaccharyltransferase complex subunit gamma
MRFSSFLAVFSLPLVALAAKKSSAERFDEFRSQATPFKLTDSSYNKITSIPRDYSVAVLLTALESRYGCQLCRDVQPEWELLAKSWTKGDKKAEGRLLFGTLDFADGTNVFASVSSNFSSLHAASL